jgi:hypothetical protein
MTHTPEPEGAQGVVFVASKPLNPGDREVTLELRPTNDGQLAIMAFSSLETLVAGAGPQQPWIAVPPDKVEELISRSNADGVLLDMVIPPSLWHGPAEGTQDAKH